MLALAIAGVAVGVMSEILVGSISEASESIGLSEFFVGVIVVAIVGNAAEHWVAVLVAFKGKMDLAVNIAIGSSAQVALFVAPVLVFASFFIGPDPMPLVFNGFELGAVLIAALIANQVTQEGESTWFEGVQLLAVYLILAIVFFALARLGPPMPAPRSLRAALRSRLRLDAPSLAVCWEAGMGNRRIGMSLRVKVGTGAVMGTGTDYEGLGETLASRGIVRAALAAALTFASLLRDAPSAGAAVTKAFDGAVDCSVQGDGTRLCSGHRLELRRRPDRRQSEAAAGTRLGHRRRLPAGHGVPRLGRLEARRLQVLDRRRLRLLQRQRSRLGQLLRRHGSEAACSPSARTASTT